MLKYALDLECCSIDTDESFQGTIMPFTQEQMLQLPSAPMTYYCKFLGPDLVLLPVRGYSFKATIALPLASLFSADSIVF